MTAGPSSWAATSIARLNPAAGANPWSNGPDLPLSIGGQPLGILDGPGALLVNGNLLFGAGVAQVDSAGVYSQPAWFFEFDGTGFFPTNSPPNSDCRTMDTRLLLLPDGDVMLCRQNDADFYAYRSPVVPEDRFRPVIQSCPTMISREPPSRSGDAVQRTLPGGRLRRRFADGDQLPAGQAGQPGQSRGPLLSDP